MSSAAFIAALSMGFLGSLHCAGMCGPIMLVLPFQALNGWRKAAGIGLYHFGRISIYALLGLCLHSFRMLFHPAWQQQISLGLGTLLLAIGLLSFYSARIRLRLPWTGRIIHRIASTVSCPGLPALLFSGLLNGLLPCGLVYMALALAATAATPAMAAVAMYAFGIGTLPVLVFITILKGRLRFLRADSIRRLIPVTVFFFGCLFLLRGMNLGIPYLSPKITMQNNKVGACCCHRK